MCDFRDFAGEMSPAASYIKAAILDGQRRTFQHPYGKVLAQAAFHSTCEQVIASALVSFQMTELN